MALFSRKTKKDLPAQAGAAKTDVAPVTMSAGGGSASGGKSDVSHVLHSPRITEKASMHMEGSCYVFDVATNANKKQIAAAVQEVYKVKPRKVAIVHIRSKTVRNMRTGQRGVKGGGKKAYVYLKQGETITLA